MQNVGAQYIFTSIISYPPFHWYSWGITWLKHCINFYKPPETLACQISLKNKVDYAFLSCLTLTMLYHIIRSPRTWIKIFLQLSWCLYLYCHHILCSARQSSKFPLVLEIEAISVLEFVRGISFDPKFFEKSHPYQETALMLHLRHIRQLPICINR